MLRRDAVERAVPDVHLDVVPRVEPERRGADVRADLPELVGREHAAAALLPPRDALELAELLERIDADVRVGADAERDAAMADTHDGEEPVSEIRLGGRAGADTRPAVAEQVELDAVGVCRVDDGRPLAEAPRRREELDRPQSVLGEALLDLARLLVRVDVEHEAIRLRVAPDLLEPIARARAHGVGGDADPDPTLAERLDLGEVRRHGRLSRPIEPTAAVRDVQAGEADSRLLGRLRRGEGGVEPEVVELADRRVPRRPHLAVGAHVEVADRGRCVPLRVGEHPIAPGPEVAAGRTPAERPLEGMAVRVHEARKRNRSRHGRRH